LAACLKACPDTNLFQTAPLPALRCSIKVRRDSLDKVQKSMAAAKALTNQLFYDHLLVIHSMPLNGNLFDCSTIR